MKRWILTIIMISAFVSVQARCWDVIFPSGTFHNSGVSNLGLGITGSKYVTYGRFGKQKECVINYYNQNNIHINYGRKNEINFFGLSVSNNFILHPNKLDFGSLIIGAELSYFPRTKSGFKEYHFVFNPSLGYYFFLGNVSVGYAIPFGATGNSESYTKGLTIKLSFHPGDIFLLWD